MTAPAFDAVSAARSLEAVGVESDQAEAIAGAVAAQAYTRADPVSPALSVFHWNDPERGQADDSASDKDPTLRLHDCRVVVRRIRGVQYHYSCCKAKAICTRQIKGDEVDF